MSFPGQVYGVSEEGAGFTRQQEAVVVGGAWKPSGKTHESHRPGVALSLGPGAGGRGLRAAWEGWPVWERRVLSASALRHLSACPGAHRMSFGWS